MVARVGAHPIAVAAPSGFGSVTWLGLDPFRGTFGRWAGRQEFWRERVTAALGARASPSRLASGLVQASVQEALELPRLPVPSKVTTRRLSPYWS